MSDVDRAHTAIVRTIDTLPQQTLSMLAQAIDKGLSVDVLERLLAMQERMLAKNAAEQYSNAMVAFKAEMPLVERKKPVIIDGQVAYYYAPLESIAKQLDPLLCKHGFYYSFNTRFDDSDKRMYIDVIVSHIGGHTETRHASLALTDRKTKLMSDTQVEMGTMTSLTRRALCNAFGITTADEDRDGRRERSVPRVEEDTIAEIGQLFEQSGLSTGQGQAVLAKYKVKEVAQLTQPQAAHLIGYLKQVIVKHNTRAKEEGANNDL